MKLKETPTLNLGDANPCLEVPEIYQGVTFEAWLEAPMCLMEKGHEGAHEFLPSFHSMEYVN